MVESIADVPRIIYIVASFLTGIDYAKYLHAFRIVRRLGTTLFWKAKTDRTTIDCHVCVRLILGNAD
jgi:hypothetical protein